MVANDEINDMNKDKNSLANIPEVIEEIHKDADGLSSTTKYIRGKMLGKIMTSLQYMSLFHYLPLTIRKRRICKMFCGVNVT
jgi:hypothetical protein